MTNDKIRIYKSDSAPSAEYWEWKEGRYEVRGMSPVRAALAISASASWSLHLVAKDEAYAEWDLTGGDEGRGGPER